MKSRVRFRMILSVIIMCLTCLTINYGQNADFKPYLQIVADPDGSMWLATNKGAVNISVKGEPTIYDKAKGLNADLVTQIFIDKDGSKWFVHAGFFKHGNSMVQAAGGVSHLKNDGTIEIFGYDKGLPSGFVNCVAADIDNSKWFGTNSGAVHLKVNGETEVFNKKNGIPGSNIRQIFIDKKGMRWFVTDDGVVRMDKSGKIVAVHPN